MLNRDDILRFLADHKQEMRRRFSVRRIGLFGSCLRGKVDERSDVDILVELDRHTFDDYMDLKFFLEEGLGRPVDLVLADVLKPRIRRHIMREVIHV
jgi:hypothetical protein